MTSNPAIFEKAILGSERLRRAARRGRRARASDRGPLRRRSPSRTSRRPATCCAPSGTTTDQRRRLRLARGRPDLARDADETLAEARRLWEAVDRPNLMIKIPGTDEGLRPIEEAIDRGHQRQRDAALRRRGLRGGRRGVHPGLERRHEAGDGPRRPLRRVVLRLARRHRGRQAPREARRARRARRARPGSPTPAPPTSASRRSSTASASPRCARPARRSSARCGRRPASRTRRYPDTLYVDELVGPDTVNTMPMATLQAAAEHGEVDRARHRSTPDPTEDLEALRRRRHRHGRRHRQAAARGHRRVRDADGEAARRHRVQARGDRHRPADDDRVEHPRRARGARSPRASRRPPRRTSRGASGPRTTRCGARRARPRSPTASAG